jgi:uncharacterized protein (DUF302 family)
MKAFITYQFKDSISELTNFLTENGISVFDSLTDIDYGASFQKAIKKAISDCDFIIVIYSSANANISFEAGIAFGANKPIFSIISEKNDDPDFLYDSTYVHALPTEIEKIKFNLTIFLEKIKPKIKVSQIKTPKFYGGGFPNYYTDIYLNYKKLDKSNEKNYEPFFKDIFTKFNVSVIQQRQDSKAKFFTDFCIWSDQLNNILGNPILIEIKKEINKKNINEIQNSVISIIDKNFADCCLIFYDVLKDIDKKDLPNTSKYFFIEISDFIEKLNFGDFNDSIRKIRNEIVHNIY